MVAIDQSRDDLSAERERGSVARWPLAMKLPSPLLFDCRHCYFLCGVEPLDGLGSEKHKVSAMRSAHAGVATSKDAAT
jgi:hypothetical protein